MRLRSTLRAWYQPFILLWCSPSDGGAVHDPNGFERVLENLHGTAQGRVNIIAQLFRPHGERLEYHVLRSNSFGRRAAVSDGCYLGLCKDVLINSQIKQFAVKCSVECGVDVASQERRTRFVSQRRPGGGTLRQ